MWRVLIAEDDLKTQKNLLKGLQPLGNCLTVTNGEEALKVYCEAIDSRQPFDFILLDITMPKMGGFDVLKSIRAHEQTLQNSSAKETCIIVITAYKDSLLENYNMGWNDFITKPVDIDRLINRMHQLKGASP